MSQRINVNLRPSGGYVFRDVDGSMHRGASWGVVIQKVRDYRSRNGRAVGEVEREVMDQSCVRYPSLCRPEAQGIPPGGVGIPRPRPAARVNELPLKVRILTWAAHLFSRIVRKDMPEYVSAEEAAARESICAPCPQNQPFMGTGCSSCKKAIADYRDAIIPGRQRFGRINGCSILGVDLVTSVHLEEVRVENPALPSVCWRKIAV